MKLIPGNRDPRIVEAIECAIDLDLKGQTEQAAQHLSTLIAEFPATASLRGYLALFLYRSRRFDEAIEQGRHAVLLSPKSEKASLIFFQALWRVGQHVEALDEMKRFLEIRQSDEYSKIIREWKLDVDDEQRSD
jgi:predicted Zn-dependent protease